MKNRYFNSILVAGLASTLVACGGSDSDSEIIENGSFSLGVTDAPTAEFTKFMVPFTGVVLQPEKGERIEFTFDTSKELDLLTLQGGVSAPLLDNVEIPSGNYSWIRLVLDEENIFAHDSIGGVNKVAVPSGGETGLKLVSGFTVSQSGGNNFTIDFDVRKSVVNPQGGGSEYLLKPALRLVDNLQVGSISGTVNYTPGMEGCDSEGFAYIYEGSDAQVSDLDVNVEGGPLVTTPVKLNDSTGVYEYKVGFLEEGEYTVSYSCQLDDNETTESIEFHGTRNVSVTANEDTDAGIIDIPVNT